MSIGRQTATTIRSSNDAATSLEKQSANYSGDATPPITLSQYWATRIPEQNVLTACAGISGAVSALVSCPLDVIKTKLQAQGGFQIQRPGTHAGNTMYRGVSGTAATIWKAEGIRGMYRGLGPMLLGYIPTWAIFLTVYDGAQSFVRTKTDNWFFANICASLCGGACSTMATNPIWVIKTRLMAQSTQNTAFNHSSPPWHYRNTFDAARKMYGAEGLLSFYSGLAPALLGLTHVAIQFPLYELFKAKFTGLGYGTSASEEDKSHHFYGLSFAIFLSKVCASTATYPHEVIRTRLQTQQRSSPSNGIEGHNFHKMAVDGRNPHPTRSEAITRQLPYRGTIQTCKVIFREEGWRGFYAGLGTNLIRAIPSAMTTLLTFEYLKKTANNLRQEGQVKLGHSGSPVI